MKLVCSSLAIISAREWNNADMVGEPGKALAESEYKRQQGKEWLKILRMCTLFSIISTYI